MPETVSFSWIVASEVGFDNVTRVTQYLAFLQLRIAAFRRPRPDTMANLCSTVNVIYFQILGTSAQGTAFVREPL